MIRFYWYGIGFFLLLFIYSSMASTYSQQTDQARTTFYFSSLNYLIPTYPKNLQRRITILERAPDVTRIPLSIDVFGYYKPHGTNLIGGILKWSTDYYSAYDNRFQIEYYQAAGSVLYYFIRKERQTHFFMRGDLGPVCMRLSSSDRGTEKLNFGLGVQIGLGYSLRTGNVSLMPAYHYSLMLIMGKIHRQSNVGVGVLY